MAAPQTRRGSKSGSGPTTRKGKSADRRPAPARASARAVRTTPRVDPPEPEPSPAAKAKAAQATFLKSWQALLARLGAIALAPSGSVAIHQASVAGPRPSWMYLSSGLAERGLELTLRVPRSKEEVAPPPWAEASFRDLVATATAGEVARLGAGRVLTPGLAIAPGTGSELASFAFLPDPSLPAAGAAPAPIVPLLAVGLTHDEVRLVREWSPQGLLEVLARTDPLLLTDPDRPSLLQSPRARTAIEQRVEREGSSLATMTAAQSELHAAGGKTTWRLSADAVETFASLLKGRTGHQRPFSIHAARSTVQVVPAESPTLSVDAERATLGLSQAAARFIRSTLRATPGRYVVDPVPGLTIEVV
jgi:Suppressor of fused protein (SUFU)